MPSFLSPEEKKNAQMQGLLGVASGLLDASKPSLVPRSLGQGLSKGLTAGLAAMNNAQTQAMKRQAFGMQKEVADVTNAYRTAQTDALRAAASRTANARRRMFNLYGGDPRKAWEAGDIDTVREVDPQFYEVALERMQGPWQGSSMEAQAFRILNEQDPSSPVYAQAYNFLGQPKTSFDAKSGQMVSITPNMSAFRSPAGAQSQGGGDSYTYVDGALVKDATSPTSPAGVSVSEVKTPEQARADATSAQESQDMLRTVRMLQRHPGREGYAGVSALIPAKPGGNEEGYISLLDQLKGQAFLQAYQKLKGGGQITEVEGQKAEQALARLNNRRVSDEEWLDNLRELESVLVRATERLQGVPESELTPIYLPAWARERN